MYITLYLSLKKKKLESTKHDCTYERSYVLTNVLINMSNFPKGVESKIILSKKIQLFNNLAQIKINTVVRPKHPTP